MKKVLKTSLQFTLLISLLAIAHPIYAQNFTWAKSMGGPDMDWSKAITTDVNGNVYTTGFFFSTADFDPGAATFNLTSVWDTDIFISKLDAAGNFIWAKHIGGIGSERARSITTDAAGNVYITGYFQNTIDFDPGPGIFNLTSAGSDDIFICKLDPAGNFVWAKKMGGGLYDMGHSITLDITGNVYTTGLFKNTADFDPGAGTFNLFAIGGNDIFISKLDAAGNFIWAKGMEGTASYDWAHTITTDAAGNVYTTGYFGDTVDFDPGAGTFNLIAIGGIDVFICKLDTAGNFVWAKSIGGINLDYGQSITSDAAGNVYSTGYFSGTADFDPGAGTFNLTSAGNHDIFISKLDPAGNFVWAKKMGGGLYDMGHSITLDITGNVYTTGLFKNTADFDPGAGTFNLFAIGGSDVFISKLDAAGNFVWAKRMGGVSDDVGFSITTDAAGNVYTTGYFGSTVDFDPGADTFNLIAIGASDIFISKLGCTGVVTGTDTQTGCNDFTWIDGNTYTSSGNSTATFNIVNGAVNGCDSVLTLNLTINNVDTSVTQNGATLTSNATAVAYQWIDCDNGNAPIAGDTNQTFMATVNGNYAVVVTKNGCTDTSACYAITKVGLKELATSQITIYPNPTHGSFVIGFDNGQEETLSYTITTLAGKIVMQAKNITGNNIEVDLGKESKGLYFLTINTGDVHGTYKILRW